MFRRKGESAGAFRFVLEWLREAQLAISYEGAATRSCADELLDEGFVAFGLGDDDGIDHVGIGSDFYDAGGPSMAEGLENVTKLPDLLVELLRRGYTDEEVKKVAGLNLLRAMREMERVAEMLRDEKPSPRDLKNVRAR